MYLGKRWNNTFIVRMNLRMSQRLGIYGGCRAVTRSEGRRQKYPHRSLILLCLNLYLSFPSRQLLTSRKSAIRVLSVLKPELSISVSKQIDDSFQWSLLLSTIALDQSVGEKSISHCKKISSN